MTAVLWEAAGKTQTTSEREMNMRYPYVITLLAALITSAVASSVLAQAVRPAPPVGPPGGGSNLTIAEIVVATSGEFDANPFNYDILLAALQAAGLADALADADATFTVFAPNDQAFKRLASDLGWEGGNEAEAWEFLVAALTDLGDGDPIPVLTAVLLYHVAGEEITYIDIIQRSIQGDLIDTLVGATIQPRFNTLIDNEPNLTDPKLFAPFNLMASNGIIHTIDRVLLPIELP
jgi:serralysin